MSSAYHPQSDGQTEVVNRCLETYLRCFTGCKPKQWPKWLPWAEYWYNTNYHATLQMTPFEALYGRRPPVLIWGDEHHTSVDEVQMLTRDRNAVLKELREIMSRAQNRMRQQADKHRREVSFEVGDSVYLKIQPYKLKQLAKRSNQKLSPKFYGPYTITEKISSVAYKLQLPPESRVHPVFHVSLLKKAIPTEVPVQPLPACLTDDWELQVEPEEALAVRTTKQGIVEVLIKWKHLPTCENSWEEWQEVQDLFPQFHLGDKVSLEGGGVDRPLDAVGPKRFGKWYARKKKGKGGDNCN